MLQYMVEQLNEHLTRHGMITDVVLRSEHSLMEEEETQEITISFVESEEEGKPVASIHLFLLEEAHSCEVEVEVEYAGNREPDQASHLWEQARRMIPEASLTEKRRYLEPGKMAESMLLVDYHFTVERPQTKEAAECFAKTLEQFAADLGKLLRL